MESGVWTGGGGVSRVCVALSCCYCDIRDQMGCFEGAGGHDAECRVRGARALDGSTRSAFLAAVLVNLETGSSVM